MEYGTSGVLSRLADPFWFQALGCVMGMDWHSSGMTPSVTGALNQAVNPLFGELGLWICGGKGKHSLRTPRELSEFASRTGSDGNALGTASRLSAKVDNTCINDGFQLYHHSIADVKRVISRERRISGYYGGRTVAGPVASPDKEERVEQLSLFSRNGFIT